VFSQEYSAASLRLVGFTLQAVFQDSISRKHNKFRAKIFRKLPKLYLISASLKMNTISMAARLCSHSRYDIIKI